MLGGEIYNLAKPVTKSSVIIRCKCGNVRKITAGAVYNQYIKNKQYRCPSCAGRSYWTPAKRITTSNNSKKNWKNPTYAGTIQGKAIANEIKRITS